MLHQSEQALRVGVCRTINYSQEQPITIFRNPSNIGLSNIRICTIKTFTYQI